MSEDWCFALERSTEGLKVTPMRPEAPPPPRPKQKRNANQPVEGRKARRAEFRAEKKRLKKVEREVKHLAAICENPEFVAALKVPDDDELPEGITQEAVLATMIEQQALRVTKYRPNASKRRKYGIDGSPNLLEEEDDLADRLASKPPNP